MFSSETLFEAAMLDTMDVMSPAALYDYGFTEEGVDQTALFAAYQRAVRIGEITVEGLHKELMNNTLHELLTNFGYYDL